MVKELVRRTNPLELRFDSRSALRMRWYYRALLHGLDKCIPLARGTVPSQCPVAFYRLSIAGVAVLPGLTGKAYMAMLNDRRRRTGEAPLPLPDWESRPPLPPVPGAGGAIGSPPLGDEPVKPAPRGGGRGPRGVRAGRGRGEGRGRGDAGRPPPEPDPFVTGLVALPPPSPPLSDGGADVVLLPPPEPEARPRPRGRQQPSQSGGSDKRYSIRKAWMEQRYATWCILTRRTRSSFIYI